MFATITNGGKLPGVYDTVGKDTFMKLLDCLRPRDLMVSFGQSSGAVGAVDRGIFGQKGSLTLEGEVEWPARARRGGGAPRARDQGHHQLEVKPRAASMEIRRKIEEALRRAAELDANRIMVETNGGELNPARRRAIMGRAPGGGAGGLVGARGDQGGQPHTS